MLAREGLWSRKRFSQQIHQVTERGSAWVLHETLTLESPPRLLLTSSASTQKALNLRIPLRITIS